jgi:hypothetical protein
MCAQSLPLSVCCAPHNTRLAHALTQHRPQGNYVLLLHLPPPHRHLAHSRRRRHSTRLRAIPVLCSRPERPRIRPLHVLVDQWLRRISALRGWHNALSLAVTALLARHVHRWRCHFAAHLQELGGLEFQQPYRHICCYIHCQRHLPLRIRSQSDHSRHGYLGGPLADRRHLLWHFLLCHRPGHLIRLQRHHLQPGPALPRWTLFRHYLQSTCSHDGIQGWSPIGL